MFLVSKFLYRLDLWFSSLNGFTLLILGPFIACCSVWANAPCWWPYLDLQWFSFINCYLDGELSHWHIFLYLLRQYQTNLDCFLCLFGFFYIWDLLYVQLCDFRMLEQTIMTYYMCSETLYSKIERHSVISFCVTRSEGNSR